MFEILGIKGMLTISIIQIACVILFNDIAVINDLDDTKMYFFCSLTKFIFYSIEWLTFTNYFKNRFWLILQLRKQKDES